MTKSNDVIQIPVPKWVKNEQGWLALMNFRRWRGKSRPENPLPETYSPPSTSDSGEPTPLTPEKPE